MWKKWIFVGAAVLLWQIWQPFAPVDAERLCVVETLVISAEHQGEVALLSRDCKGTGRTLAEAVENMREKAPGELFLRQTKRIIFCGGSQKEIDPMELPEMIPLGTAVYVTDKTGTEIVAELDTLEKQLGFRESKGTSTLADMKNRAMEEGKET